MIKIQVTVQVSADVARALHHTAPPTSESQELSHILDGLGVVLEPMHPGAEDPLLVPWFTIEAPDLATAEEVVARLQHSRATEAAFVNPLGDVPWD